MKKLEGIVRTYQHHNNRMAAIVNVATNTDFVARNEEFKEFVDNLAMHIASENPKTMEMLLAQPYLLNPERTVSDVVKEQHDKFKENIYVRSFARVTLDIEDDEDNEEKSSNK